MFLKKVVKKLYRIYLRKKWNIKSEVGVSILLETFSQDYIEHKNQIFEVHSIHNKGFSYNDWHILGLKEKDYLEYLNTARYVAMHPINGRYGHWIDDKLTLKYLCIGTALGKHMPKYYYQINGSGNVYALLDAPNKDKSICAIDDIIFLLETIGELAIKREEGTRGEGFYKAAYKNKKYYLNNTAYFKNEFQQKLKELRGYLVTEYFHPHKDMASFNSDTINTLRYLVGRNEEGKMRLIKSYIRFGTKQSAYVENYAVGGVLCYVSEDGSFDCGNILDLESIKNTIIYEHPDSKIRLKGKIPMWKKIQRIADEFGNYFPQLDYLGIDFVITDQNEVKILEINSLTDLDTIQLQDSILNSPEGDFYRKRLRTL